MLVSGRTNLLVVEPPQSRAAQRFAEPTLDQREVVSRSFSVPDFDEKDGERVRCSLNRQFFDGLAIAKNDRVCAEGTDYEFAGEAPVRSKPSESVQRYFVVIPN